MPIREERIRPHRTVGRCRERSLFLRLKLGISNALRHYALWLGHF